MAPKAQTTKGKIREIIKFEKCWLQKTLSKKWKDKKMVENIFKSYIDPWARKIPWRRKWQPTLVGYQEYSSILAWQIPWTEEPGGLQFMGSQRVGRDGGTKWRQQQNSTFIRWNSAVKRMETRTHATRRKLDSIMPNEGSRKIPHTAWSIYMKCPEEANLQKQKVCQWLLGAWGRRKWSDC